MDLLAAVRSLLGIQADVVNGLQTRLSKLDHELDALVRLHGDFAQLVGFGFSQGITPFGGGSDTQQQQQDEYLGGGFHFCSFLFSGRVNMDSSTSSVSFSSCFSTSST